MNPTSLGLSGLARLTSARTRSISAENPDGRKGGGAQALPGRPGTTPAASALGRGWKVRPCLRNLRAGQRVVLADIEGPGVVQHLWFTVLTDVHRWLALRVYYDGATRPSIEAPLGDFFANGIDGLALVNSMPVAVNPKGGMNSYWPMPFRERFRLEIANDGRKAIDELFYQITYSLEDVPEDAGYFHASWRRSTTKREMPEHVILDLTSGGAACGLTAAAERRGSATRARRGSPAKPLAKHGVDGHYVGTYVVWNQLSSMWWGEGEVKFFIDGDEPDSPTICGTGTEDYFGGAWGFLMDHTKDQRPTTYSTAFLGYPQAVYEAMPAIGRALGPRPPAHGLYRWHIPDPVRFAQDLRVTVQALGWWPNGKYQPLADDIASVAYWYQRGARAVEPLPSIEGRYPR